MDAAAEGGGVSSARDTRGERVVMAAAVTRWLMKDLRVGTSLDVVGAAAR